MTIEIWLILALSLSVTFNFVLVWFSREQSQRLSYVSQNLGDLVEMLSSYRKHIKSVYEMEMFYQEPTLKHLMEHTNALVSLLQSEYGEVTYLTDPLEVIIEETDEKEETINF